MNHQPIQVQFVLTDIDLPELNFNKLPLATRNQITLVVGKKLLRQTLELLKRYESLDEAKAVRFTQDDLLREVPVQIRSVRELLKRAHYGAKVINDGALKDAVHDLVLSYTDFINTALDEGFLTKDDPIPRGWLSGAGSDNRILALRALVASDRAVVEYMDRDEYLTITLTIGYSPAERQERLRGFRQPTVGEAILDLIRKRFKRSKPRNF